MNLANRLRVLMKWRGIKSQNQLARISGVPQSSIHRILVRGDNYAPKRNTLKKLANALSTTSYWLSDGVETINPPRSTSLLIREISSTADYRMSQAHSPIQDGCLSEMQCLITKLPETDRKKVLAILRLLAKPYTSYPRKSLKPLQKTD